VTPILGPWNLDAFLGEAFAASTIFPSTTTRWLRRSRHNRFIFFLAIFDRMPALG
jgi:hypothetical protein